MKSCDEVACTCGVASGSGIIADPSCGFETPCAYLGCEERSDQPCYTGPPQTLGVGACRAGRASCESGRWGSCIGEVTPALEICGNGLDDDCDGVIDGQDGSTDRSCAAGASCVPGAEEICANGLDDDCDGAVDELCEALPGGTQACYRGPASTRGTGACRDGTQHEEGGVWGPCMDDVLPRGEICHDGEDSDCNNLGGPGQLEDPGCSEADVEICNGIDDDGDGEVDEGVLNSCGTCGACEQHSFESPADCDAPFRTCSQVKALADDERILTIDRDKRWGDDGDFLFHFRPGATPGMTQLAKFDLRERSLVWTVPMRGSFSGPAMPMQAAGGLLVLPDGSVWAGTVPSLDESGTIVDSTTSWLYHADRNGRIICQAAVPGGIASIAAAPDGNIWIANGVGTNQGFTLPEYPIVPARNHLIKFSGTDVDLQQRDGSPWPDGVPRCRNHDLSPNDSVEIGFQLPLLAWQIKIDSRGILWMQGHETSELWAMFDTRTNLLTLLPSAHGHAHQSMQTADDDSVWGSAGLNSGQSGYVSRFDAVTAAAGPTNTWAINPGFQAFKLEEGGTLVGVGYHQLASLIRFDPATGASWALAPLPSGGPRLHSLFVAQDSRGLLWVQLADCHSYLDSCTSLGAYNPGSEAWEVFPFLEGVYSTTPLYSDPVFTSAARQFAGTGHWATVVDAVYPHAQWKVLDWEEHVPPGAEVEAWVTFARSPAGLDEATATPCGPFQSPPIDLSSCGADGLRFARVELVLRTGIGNERPSVRNIQLRWARP